VTAAAPATGLVVAATRAELAVALDALRSKGSRIALVPTMGALHEGHRALVTRAAALTDAVVVSIFLNPLQFAAGEDLARYPRTLDSDLALCAAEGVAVVFAPMADEVYPVGEPMVRVAAGGLGEILEGASRPGHFDGVLTVVAKLFGLVRPDVAVFGEKDAQQLRLVRQMVDDLDIPVRIEAVPIVRTTEGLALSSRNKYLDGPAMHAALALSRSVAAAQAAGAAGRTVEEVLSVARQELRAEQEIDVDYCVLVDPESFAHLAPGAGGPGLLLVAAKVGATRLIDNAVVDLGSTVAYDGGTLDVGAAP
jgi:pantoate--beta-alanine ligase